MNHGLVFRHFGSKEQLVGAVLDYLGISLTQLPQTGAPAEDVDAALDRQMRVMARTLLDGYPAGQLQARFPNVSLLLDQVRPRYESELSARLASPTLLLFNSAGGCSDHSCVQRSASTR